MAHILRNWSRSWRNGNLGAWGSLILFLAAFVIYGVLSGGKAGGQPTNLPSASSRSLATDTNGILLQHTNFLFTNIHQNWLLRGSRSNAAGLVLEWTGYTNGPILYVSTNGNDTTAIKGRKDRPWASISNAVATATHGDIVHILAGTYFVKATENINAIGATGYPIQVDLKTNVTIRGDGWNTRIQCTNGGGVITVHSSEGITIRDLWIDGYRTNSYASLFSMIYFQPTNRNSAVVGVKISNSGDHGITGTTATACETNTLIQGCWFYNIGSSNAIVVGTADGTAVANIGFNTTVTDCFFEQCYRVFELEGDAASYSGAKFVNNTVLNCIQRGVMIFSDGATPPTDYTQYHHIDISGNTFISDTNLALMSVIQTAVVCNGGRGIRITGNKVYNYRYIGFDFTAGTNCEDIIISENHLERIGLIAIVATEINGVEGRMRGFTIIDNTIVNCTNTSIQLIAQNSVISGNRIRNFGAAGGTDYAIYLRSLGTGADSSNCVVSGNFIYNDDGITSGDRGVLVEARTRNCYIYDNFMWNLDDATPMLLNGATNIWTWGNYFNNTGYFPSGSSQHTIGVGLTNLADVVTNMAGIANNDVLQYDSTSGKWTNNAHAIGIFLQQTASGGTTGGSLTGGTWTNRIYNAEQSDPLDYYELDANGAILVRYPGTYRVNVKADIYNCGNGRLMWVQTNGSGAVIGLTSVANTAGATALLDAVFSTTTAMWYSVSNFADSSSAALGQGLGDASSGTSNVFSTVLLERIGGP